MFIPLFYFLFFYFIFIHALFVDVGMRRIVVQIHTHTAVIIAFVYRFSFRVKLKHHNIYAWRVQHCRMNEFCFFVLSTAEIRCVSWPEHTQNI